VPTSSAPPRSADADFIAVVPTTITPTNSPVNAAHVAADATNTPALSIHSVLNQVEPPRATVPSELDQPHELESSGTNARETTVKSEADLEAERRAYVDARAHRRMVKNLVLAGICVTLLVVTLWALLVIGPL